MSEAEAIRAELARAARQLGAPEDFDPKLERPRDREHGDWATNSAMLLAKRLGRTPRDVALALIGQIDFERAGIRAADVAGPGFINIRVDPARAAQSLAAIIAADEAYGRNTAGGGAPVNVEFVSANPTGPLHVGHGRQAALGDAIATLLEWAGWKVSREFYYNDAGVQIEKLAQSVWLRIGECLGETVTIPEGGYNGEYIRDIAGAYYATRRDDLTGDAWRAVTQTFGTPTPATTADTPELGRVRAFAVAALREEQDRDLQAFGVHFDTYYLESSLYTDGLVEDTVGALERAGKLYEKDDALWLRTTDWGDDKDRVARKRDGTYTYFVPDVAYHVTKWRRGFRRAINVQGSDHHSTVTRVRAGLQALGIGIPVGYPDYVLHQMVTVMRGGEEVKISKRAGSYVTVRDLIDEVGRDAVRYFFVMRKSDSPLVFDVDLARSQSEENPVYYIQMAHARMSGIFRVGGIEANSITGEGVDLGRLTLPEEVDVVKALLDFPQLIAGAAASFEPHRVAADLLDTARKVHLWYHKAHVLLEGDDADTIALRDARLVLARASRIVLRNGLTALGLTAPERM